MDPRLYILTRLDGACRQTALDDSTSPSWNDGQCIRSWTLRLERHDTSAWTEFQQRIETDRQFTVAILSILIERDVVLDWFDDEEKRRLGLSLPADVKPLSAKDERRFLKSLDVWNRDLVVCAHSWTRYFPGSLQLYKREDPKKFSSPKEASGEIMYIEMKPGLSGPARIGRVNFSKTRKTMYYAGKKLKSLKGSGYKANYFNVESGMWYWVSKCRKDGNDALYPATVEIDEDVREQYWTEIRQQPENMHLTKFRSSGKYSKRKPS